MALLSKFFKPKALKPKAFKPKWQHNDPEVRRQAINELKSDDQRLAFINAENLPELRRLAIIQITDEHTLEQLLGHSQNDVRSTVRQHWLSQLLNGDTDLNHIADNNTLIRIASLTDDQQQRLAAVARITDQNERLQLAMHNPVAKVRLAAAEGINDSDKLQQLLNHAQGKDKAVYRLCKDRLSANKAEREAQQAVVERINALQANAEQLNRLGYNPEFNGRFQVISKDWQALSSQANTEQQQAIEALLKQAQDTLTQHAAEEARQAEARQAAELAAQQQQALLTELQRLLDEAVVSVPSDLSEQITALQQSWSNTATQHKANAEHSRQFENQLQQLLAIQTALSHFAEKENDLKHWLEQKLPTDMRGLSQLRKQAQQWQKTLHWPLDDHQPGWVVQIAARLEQAEQALEQLSQQQNSRLHTIDEQLQKLEQALADGHAKEASKLNQQLQQNLRQVDNKIAQPQQRKAKLLGAQLNEMRDWQGFAITPKKEALCDAMEALIGADIEPGLLADQIHQLQEDWKALGSAQPDRDLWARFQAAGDKAFEPCRDYFAELAGQRQQFVAARKALTAELISYEQQLDWDNADWKVVQKTLDAARDTFRQYSPVDRAAHKETQAEFHDACDAIYAHLKAEYDRNLQSKAELVQQAEGLIEHADLAAAIEQVKTLQQQWKQIGVTPRNPDQKLWKQFRSACDAIFARLDNEKAERKAVISDAVASAEKIVADAEALTTQELADGAAIADAHNALAEFKQQFAAIELPKSAHQRLMKKLQSLENTLKDKRQELKQAAEKARWNGLIDRLNAIAKRDADAFAAAAQLPAGYQAELFEQALNGECDPSGDAQATVIAMEVLADIESPQSDKARRMELQVQKLAQGLGQSHSQDAERQQLVEQWLQCERTDALQQRFIAALKASL